MKVERQVTLVADDGSTAAVQHHDENVAGQSQWQRRLATNGERVPLLIATSSRSAQWATQPAARWPLNRSLPARLLKR